MASNKEMIEAIRKKLNVVNKSIIDPDKFEEADSAEIKQIYEFVNSKESFSPSEINAIAEALGELRQ